MITPAEKAEVRRELLDEIIEAYAQLIDIYSTGGEAPFTGHAFDPRETEREVKQLQQLKQTLMETRDKEAAKAASHGG